MHEQSGSRRRRSLREQHRCAAPKFYSLLIDEGVNRATPRRRELLLRRNTARLGLARGTASHGRCRWRRWRQPGSTFWVALTFVMDRA